MRGNEIKELLKFYPLRGKNIISKKGAGIILFFDEIYWPLFNFLRPFSEKPMVIIQLGIVT